MVLLKGQKYQIGDHEHVMDIVFPRVHLMASFLQCLIAIEKKAKQRKYFEAYDKCWL